MTIDELAIKYNTDKSSLDHQYTKHYQKYFDKYVLDPKKILELGIYTTKIDKNGPLLDYSGASLKTWAEYYPKAIIYGLDLIDFKSIDTNWSLKNIKTFACNCEIRKNDDFDHLQDKWLKSLINNPNQKMIGGKIGIESMVETLGSNFDIIIDDGPHTMTGQQIFLGSMFKHLNSGGIFVVEDLFTSKDNRYNHDPYTDKTTLWMFENYKKTGKIVSDFMTKDEIDYLENNIQELTIEIGKHSEIVFITKK